MQGSVAACCAKLKLGSPHSYPLANITKVGLSLLINYIWILVLKMDRLKMHIINCSAIWWKIKALWMNGQSRKKLNNISKQILHFKIPKLLTDLMIHADLISVDSQCPMAPFLDTAKRSWCRSILDNDTQVWQMHRQVQGKHILLFTV